MSYEQFGMIISLHQELRVMLDKVIKERSVLNMRYETKNELFKLAGLLFGTSIGSFSTLEYEAKKFNDSYQDWIDDGRRAASQLTYTWASMSSAIEGDDFIDTYIIAPIKMATDSTETSIKLLTSSTRDRKETQFNDFINMMSFSRSAKYSQTESFNVSPMALVTQAYTGNLNSLLTQTAAPDVNLSWADGDSIYLIGKYVSGNVIAFTLPSYFNYVYVDNACVGLTNTVAGVYTQHAAFPIGEVSLRVTNTSGQPPRYPVDKLVEMSFKTSAVMSVILETGHGVAANKLVILRIQGRFTMQKCGFKELAMMTNMQPVNTVGFSNFAFGSTIPQFREGCSSTMDDVMNATYAAIYIDMMTKLNSNNEAESWYPLSGKVHQPSLMLYSLFGSTAIDDANRMGINLRRSMATAMLRIASVLCGLGIYSM